MIIRMLKLNSLVYFQAFSPMIATAKQLALNPDNKTIHSKWQQTNNEVKISLMLCTKNFNVLVDRCDWECSRNTSSSNIQSHQWNRTIIIQST